MSTVNDFVLDVCENDYVIYATYDAMYPYAFRILKDEILSKTVDGTLSLSANESFLFRKSEFKDI